MLYQINNINIDSISQKCRVMCFTKEMKNVNKIEEKDEDYNQWKKNFKMNFILLQIRRQKWYKKMKIILKIQKIFFNDQVFRPKSIIKTNVIF